MPTTGATIYHYLISCPSDGNLHVKEIKETIEKFNCLYGSKNNIRIEARHWETDSYAQSGGDPQDLLNNQFIKDCDAAIAVFRTRFGTPTKNYGSGTEEEIRTMMDEKKQVFLYFLKIDADQSIQKSQDKNQIEKIQQFKNNYHGLHAEFQDEEELQELIFAHLIKYFDEHPELTNVGKDVSPKENAITIGVQSVIREVGNLKDEVDLFLNLVDFFDAKELKKEYSWNQNIAESISSFIREKLKVNTKYEIIFNAHLTIGFYFGYCLDTKSGVTIYPVQSTNGNKVWSDERNDTYQYDKLIWKKIEYSKNGDSVLILNISTNIYEDVESYIKTADIEVKTIYNFKLGETSQKSVKDGYHVNLIVNDIRDILMKRDPVDKNKILHIFAAAPVALMFILGKVSKCFGNMILYEFDFYRQNGGAYTASLKLPRISNDIATKRKETEI